jgi:hypothetical protein
MSHRKLAFVVSGSFLLAGILPLGANADLVAHYKLDEASGVVHDSGAAPAADSTNELKDPKDYAQPGVPAGKYGDLTVTDEQAKALKSSVHISSTDGLNLGPAEKSKLNLTGNFTVTGWFKLAKTDGYHMLFATGAGSGNGWKVGVDDGGFLFTANGVSDLTLDGPTVDADKWYHLAVTVEGTTAERKVTFYINGKRTNTDALTVDNITTSDAKQMHIGTADNADDTSENLDGNVADIRLYNTVLSEKEIQEAATAAK